MDDFSRASQVLRMARSCFGVRTICNNGACSKGWWESFSLSWMDTRLARLLRLLRLLDGCKADLL